MGPARELGALRALSAARPSGALPGYDAKNGLTEARVQSRIGRFPRRGT